MKVKDIKRAIFSYSPKEIVEFIKNNYAYSTEKKLYEYRNNLDVLKKLDNDTLMYAIAKMKQIEENKDLYKSLSGSITCFLQAKSAEKCSEIYIGLQ